MGSIPFAVTIQPRPKRATTASAATSGTAQGSVGQGGTGGGGGGTSGATSTSSATGTSATGSHGAIAAPTDSNAWTGDLAGYQDLGNTAAVIGTVPARTDATTDPGSGTTQDTTATHGPKHTDGAPGTAPTSTDTSITSAPTGTDSLTSAHDLDGAFNNGTPAGQTPTAGTPGQGGPTVDGHHHTDSTSVSAGTKQDILDTVNGKNTGQSVADTLTPTSGPHGHSGGASSGPPAAGDPLTQTASPATSQAADVRHAAAATGGPAPGSPSTWSGSTPAGNASMSVPTAGVTEVPAGTGLRGDDLVTPIEGDVHLPAGTVPPPLVRHHKRPWIGTGEAPGSTSDNVIEEHEILGYASVGIPHLAEIWRLHADGREEYVSTCNQRNGQWLGDNTPSHQPIGRRIDNGAYATLSDGTVFRSMVLTERHSVLIAYGVSAPEHFEQVHDGSYRLVVENSDIVSLMGVTTIGAWRALPVQLLHRQGDMLLVDYAGDDPIAAAAAGFPQTNQGQWQPRWVEHTEVTDVQELERPYPLPRAVVTSQTSDVPVGARS